jgi:hypothetical protein
LGIIEFTDPIEGQLAINDTDVSDEEVQADKEGEEEETDEEITKPKTIIEIVIVVGVFLFFLTYLSVKHDAPAASTHEQVAAQTPAANLGLSTPSGAGQAAKARQVTTL